jgi:hypothetical protein
VDDLGETVEVEIGFELGLVKNAGDIVAGDGGEEDGGEDVLGGGEGGKARGVGGDGLGVLGEQFGVPVRRAGGVDLEPDPAAGGDLRRGEGNGDLTIYEAHGLGDERLAERVGDDFAPGDGARSDRRGVGRRGRAAEGTEEAVAGGEGVRGWRLEAGGFLIRGGQVLVDGAGGLDERRDVGRVLGGERREDGALRRAVSQGEGDLGEHGRGDGGVPWRNG